jgi:hypothetical protein
MNYIEWRRRRKEAEERARITTLALPWREADGIRFLDFQIDSVSLAQHLGINNVVGVLGWLPEAEDRQQRNILLGTELSRWHAPRIELYYESPIGSPEQGAMIVGDLLMPTLTATCRQEKDTILWTDFAREPCYCGRRFDVCPPDWKDFLNVPPIRFDAHQYRTVLMTFPMVDLFS